MEESEESAFSIIFTTSELARRIPRSIFLSFLSVALMISIYLLLLFNLGLLALYLLIPTRNLRCREGSKKANMSDDDI